MTVGSGPFGHRPGGRFNFEAPQRGMQYLEEFPRRIRALAAGEVVVDSVGVKLLHEQHRLPRLVLPTRGRAARRSRRRCLDLRGRAG